MPSPKPSQPVPLTATVSADAGPTDVNATSAAQPSTPPAPTQARRKPLLNRIGASISEAASGAARRVSDFFTAVGNFLNTKIWQPICKKIWGQAVTTEATAESTADERTPLLGRARQQVTAAAEHTQGIAYSFWLAISSVPGIIAQSFRELGTWLSSFVFGKATPATATAVNGSALAGLSTAQPPVADPSTTPVGNRPRAGLTANRPTSPLQPIAVHDFATWTPRATAAVATSPSLQESAGPRAEGATSPTGSFIDVKGPSSDASSSSRSPSPTP